MFAESRQHSTIDLFYGFMHVLFGATRQKRDGQWLRAHLAKDAPGLSREAVDWYCEQFDTIANYE